VATALLFHVVLVVNALSVDRPNSGSENSNKLTGLGNSVGHTVRCRAVRSQIAPSA
jgi:hypothetical protein